MKYLKRTIRDDIFEYIPLDNAKFHFSKYNSNTYTVGISYLNENVSLFDSNHKRSIISLDGLMMAIANLPNGSITDVETLFDEFENVKKGKIVEDLTYFK